MKRRSLLKAFAAASAGPFILRRAKADPNQGGRTFKLLVNDNGAHPATRMMDAFAYKGNIYYLAGESDLEGVTKIGCTSFAGESVWRHRLPQGLYNGIGMSENGDLLTMSMSPLHKGEAAGSIYSVIPGDGNPPEVNWLAVVPRDANTSPDSPSAFPFLRGRYFGSVSSGLSIVMTTVPKAQRSDPPIRFSLAPPAFEIPDIWESGESVVIVDRQTGDAGRYDTGSASYSQKAISGAAISSTKERIQVAVRGQAVSPNLIGANGIVNNSLHLLTGANPIRTATYAWCDPTFTIVGAKQIDTSAFFDSHTMAVRILQLGAETAIVFSDGTVLAFPIPS